MQDQANLFRETWSVYQDIDNSQLPLGPRRGDLRAAISPFLANNTVGALLPDPICFPSAKLELSSCDMYSVSRILFGNMWDPSGIFSPINLEGSIFGCGTTGCSVYM